MSEPIKSIQGKDDKGDPWANYSWVNRATGQPVDGFLGHVMYLGPVLTGTILLADGSGYDLSPDYIDCKPEHVGPINHHIAKLLVDQGKLESHTCTDECGTERE